MERGNDKRNIRVVDCFAFKVKDNRFKCNALNPEVFDDYYKNGYCGTKLCPFHKTREQHRKDIEKHNELLMRNGVSV